MFRFIHLPHRNQGSTAAKPSLRLVLVAVLLGLFLMSQVGLVLWVYLKQWQP